MSSEEFHNYVSLPFYAYPLLCIVECQPFPACPMNFFDGWPTGPAWTSTTIFWISLQCRCVPIFSILQPSLTKSWTILLLKCQTRTGDEVSQHQFHSWGVMMLSQSFEAFSPKKLQSQSVVRPCFRAASLGRCQAFVENSASTCRELAAPPQHNWGLLLFPRRPEREGGGSTSDAASRVARPL